jgi:transcriptional regulator with XRE-family HTH domain
VLTLALPLLDALNATIQIDAQVLKGDHRAWRGMRCRTIVSGMADGASPDRADEVERERVARAVREARERQGMSLRRVATRAGVSASLISHIEHGRAVPSLSTLRALAQALEIPVADLFVGDPPDVDGRAATNGAGASATRVIRPHERKHLHLPASKLKYELLSPSLTGAIEFLWSEFGPGQPETGLGSHAGEEAILVLEGALDVVFEDESFRLTAGDSITFDSSRPHRVRNPGPGTNRAVTAITPPSF